MMFNLFSIISTFLGSVFGFMFSIVIFNITEKKKLQITKNKLKNNLKKEIRYNLVILEKHKEDLDSVMNSISVGRKLIFTPKHHINFQSRFLLQAFNSGLLYELLDSESILEVQNMLAALSSAGTKNMISYLDNYRKGKLRKNLLFTVFEHYAKETKKHKKLLKAISKQLAKKN